MDRRKFGLLAASGFALALSGGAASAFPNQNITIVVPYAPGTSDQIARGLAAELEKTFGKKVLIENKTGGGGSVGAGYVARSKPDGHTLLFSVSAVQTITPLQTALPYGFSDLQPISRISVGPNVVAARADAPFKTLKEMIDYAKANPGKVSYSSSGTGGATHLALEALARASGIKLTHIPFQGAGPATAAAVGGSVDLGTGFAQAIMPQVEGKRLVAIAQFDETRAKVLPDVPTFKEGGVNLALPPHTGIWAAAGTPPEIVAALDKAFAEAVKAPAFVAFTERTQTEVGYLNSAAFTKVLKEEEAFFKQLLGELGMLKK